MNESGNITINMGNLSSLRGQNGLPIPPNMRNKHRFDHMTTVEDAEGYCMHGFVAPVIDQLEMSDSMSKMYKINVDAIENILSNKHERRAAIRFCNAVVNELRKNYTLHALANSENEEVRKIFQIELQENPAAEDWFKLEEEAGATFLPPDPSDPMLMNGLRTREQQKEFMAWKVAKRAGSTEPEPHLDYIWENLDGKTMINIR